MSSARKLRVLYIFRKPSAKFHSIENLFASVQRHLPETIEFRNFYLPFHEGVSGKIKNILFVIRSCKKFRQFDLIHITGDITYIAPFVCGKKIVTYHDLGSLLDNRSRLAQKILTLLWIKIPIVSSDAVTAISQATAREVMEISPAAEDKIHYIPNCIPDSWHRDNIDVRQRVRYALAIGVKKNKNLERIIKAIDGLGITLVIVGKPDREQQELLSHSNLEYVVWETLEYEQVRELYSQVDLVVFPSLYEGFGLPILEAQASGVPLITSNIEPMLSVSGSGAIKVNPFSQSQIRDAIVRLCDNFDLRRELVKLGLENVKDYFCSNISQQYAKLYFHLTNTKK